MLRAIEGSVRNGPAGEQAQNVLQTDPRREPPSTARRAHTTTKRPRPMARSHCRLGEIPTVYLSSSARRCSDERPRNHATTTKHKHSKQGKPLWAGDFTHHHMETEGDDSGRRRFNVAVFLLEKRGA